MTDKPDTTTREGVQQIVAQVKDDYLSGRWEWAPFIEYPQPSRWPDHPTAPPPDPFEREIGDRHAKVSEIIARGLARIRNEINALDPGTLNGDNAADRAEIARQALSQLVPQLRGFSAEWRRQIAEEKRSLYGEDDEAA